MVYLPENLLVANCRKEIQANQFKHVWDSDVVFMEKHRSKVQWKKINIAYCRIEKEYKVPFCIDKQAGIQVSKYRSKIIMPEKKSTNYVCRVEEYSGSCKVAIDCQIIYIKVRSDRYFQGRE